MPHNFEVGDFVKFEVPYLGYGQIIAVHEDSLDLNLFDDSEPLNVLIINCEFLPPVTLTLKSFKEYARFEQCFDNDVVPENITNFDTFHLSFEDLKIALENFLDFGSDFGFFINYYLRFFMTKIIDQVNNLDQTLDLDSEYYFGRKVINKLGTLLVKYNDGEYSEDDCVDVINDTIVDIDQYLTNIDLPLNERHYDEDEVLDYLFNANTYVYLNKMSLEEVEKYRYLINTYATVEHLDVVELRAYGYYSGNRIFKQDFYKASEDLLLIYHHATDAMKLNVANSLGYIYYYGRIAEKPDYELAFKYFNFAALNGVRQAILKLGDMYAHGYYVESDLKTAIHLDSFVLDQTIYDFVKGNHDSEFCDAAIRLSKAFKDKTDSDVGYYFALHYALQAKYAIELKIKEEQFFFGNAGTKKGIDVNLNELLNHPMHQTINDNPCFIDFVLSGNDFNVPYLFHFTETEDGFVIKIKGKYPRRLNKDEAQRRLFVTLPSKDFCGMVDTLYLRARGHALPQCFLNRDILVNKIVDNQIISDGEVICNLDDYTITFYNNSFNHSHDVHHFASFYPLNNPSALSYYLIDDMPEVQAGYRFSFNYKGEYIDLIVNRTFELQDYEMTMKVKDYARLSSFLKEIQ